MSWKFLGLLFFGSVFGASFSFACYPGAVSSVEIVSARMPMVFNPEAKSICLEDYFFKRDFANYSLSTQAADPMGQPLIVPDDRFVNFYDEFIIQLPDYKSESLGIERRRVLVERMIKLFLSQLRNENGQCDLTISDGVHEKSLGDFVYMARNENGVEGTRLWLKSDESGSTFWKLECPNDRGGKNVAKWGSYFFIFVDVYEYASDIVVPGFPAKFLFSLDY